MEIDQIVFARDQFRVPTAIGRTIGSSQGRRNGASGVSSSRTTVSVEEFKRLKAKVDKVDSKMGKHLGFVSEFGNG